MTHALDHVTRLETSLSGLLEHAVETHAGAEQDADEAEIARLGAELLAEPGAADTIGDLFDAVVGTDPHGREERAAVLDASWSGIGPGVD